MWGRHRKGPASVSSGTTAHRKDTTVDTQDSTVPSVPDHELIRLDAAANPQRSYREHIEAARDICGETYVEDLRRIQRRGLIEEEEM
jgi:hypothetical protein